MPSIYDLKPAFQRLLRPLVRGMVKVGMTANQVTVGAFLISAASGAAIARWPGERWPLLAVPAVLFLRMALNAIDGMMAREMGQKSRLGALLNELGDVASDAALYLPFALLPGVPAGWVVAIVVLAGLTEMAGVCALMVDAPRRYDGPMGKSDRAFFFGALALALGLGLAPGRWLEVLLVVAVLLLVLTIFQRVRRALAAGEGTP